MKTIIEQNYLGGTLTITVKPETKETFGELFIEDKIYGLMVFQTVAVCHPEDKFSEAKGIKLVKMKLTKQYHQAMAEQDAKMIAIFERGLKKTKVSYLKHKAKVDALNTCLIEEFGREPRYVKAKKAKKKTTAKK